jgi:major type 1 subunit fimbrin (pilin)
MKYTHALSVIRCGCIAGLAGSLLLANDDALAQDATINVTGRIVETTCSLATDNAVLNIGDVSITVFTGVGTESPNSPEDTLVTALNCPAAAATMTFAAPADPNNANLFAVAGGAGGVGIRLEGLNALGVWQQAIPNSTVLPIVFSIESLNEHRFRARYIQSAATVNSGPANATITVLVTYS